VAHRRLRERLVGCTDWDDLSGTVETRSLLGRLCNVEENLIDAPGISGAAVRTFNVATGLWSIYWVGSDGVLGAPVHGRFEGGVGRFEGEDSHAGRQVLVRFVWTPQGPDTARWEQAFSADGGGSWEVNWTMDFARVF
jgi:hypothetical protein